MRSADDYNPHCQRRAPVLRWVTGSLMTEATLLADELSSSRRRARFCSPGLQPFDQPVRPASLVETVELLTPRRFGSASGYEPLSPLRPRLPPLVSRERDQPLTTRDAFHRQESSEFSPESGPPKPFARTEVRATSAASPSSFPNSARVTTWAAAATTNPDADPGAACRFLQPTCEARAHPTNDRASLRRTAFHSSLLRPGSPCGPSRASGEPGWHDQPVAPRGRPLNQPESFPELACHAAVQRPARRCSEHLLSPEVLRPTA